VIRYGPQALTWRDSSLLTAVKFLQYRLSIVKTRGASPFRSGERSTSSQKRAMDDKKFMSRRYLQVVPHILYVWTILHQGSHGVIVVEMCWSLECEWKTTQSAFDFSGSILHESKCTIISVERGSMELTIL
jgi:hypothetical protein